MTGGYSGIGVEVVRALAGAGAHVLAPARRPEKAGGCWPGSTASRSASSTSPTRPASRRTPSRCSPAGRPLDLVIDNAGRHGLPGDPGRRRAGSCSSPPTTSATTRWSTGSGRRSARAPGSSASRRPGHHLSDFRWDDPWFETGYDKWLAYGQSKTANVLFAVHLDELAREQGVRAFSLHPGAILTPLGRHLQAEDLDAVMTLDEDGQPVLPDFLSPEQGAATAVWAATSPELDGRGGDYLEDCAIAEVVPDGPQTTSGVRGYALDPDAAARLWAWSARGHRRRRLRA